MLTKKIKQSIIDHANAEYPRESCGVIVGKEYIPCTNIAESDSQFRICPIDLIGAESEGKIRAFVHSHPDGTTTPSTPDMVQMNLPLVLSRQFKDKSLLKYSVPWIITDGVNVDSFKPNGYQAPLLGREYYHGLMDCYTMVRDYYQRELGILLNDYDRSDAWWEKKESAPLYLDNFKKEGFVEVSQIQKHDLILCRLGRTEHVNHALIFIGDGELQSETTEPVISDCLVLHHPYNQPSIREMYSDQWQRRAAVIIRHRSFM